MQLFTYKLFLEMIVKPDIKNRIESDFGDKADRAFDLLQAILKSDSINETDRVIRCIVFLSEKQIEKLKQYIEEAFIDPRDVIVEAEDTYTTDKSLKLIRDFSKVFEESEIR